MRPDADPKPAKAEEDQPQREDKRSAMAVGIIQAAPLIQTKNHHQGRDGQQDVGAPACDATADPETMDPVVWIQRRGGVETEAQGQAQRREIQAQTKTNARA